MSWETKEAQVSTIKGTWVESDKELVSVESRAREQYRQLHDFWHIILISSSFGTVVIVAPSKIPCEDNISVDTVLSKQIPLVIIGYQLG